ncbi:DgyrCDS1712 [Dimorphilus gyrociliatus]|uniref:DgyrCDS1712 n=1 Tax=Dimorphilus gyrociliatus TaxID=2664684 RepID=A0A7I8VA01_9ANNE|nr:DgyrCDS1712 [Dimorphilus gyrociliatus]
MTSRKLLRTLIDYEEEAQNILNEPVRSFYYSGAEYGKAHRRNIKALQKIYLCPNICVDVSERDTSANFLGYSIPIPLGISPTAQHKHANFEGELATARAAAYHNTPYVMSLFSNISVRQVIHAVPGVKILIQLQFMKDRDILSKLLNQFINDGVKGICLTLDIPIINPTKPGLLSLASKYSIPNIPTELREKTKTSLTLFDNDHITWEDVAWFISKSTVPVIVKGVLSPKNALEAINIGAAGIWISNHGGRQLADAPPTIEALRVIAPLAKKAKIPLYIDGGIRSGGDILKCLALGADIVFLGRPIISGLVVGGYKGVVDTLNIIKRDFEANMAMCGFKNVKEINEKCLWENISKI